MDVGNCDIKMLADSYLSSIYHLHINPFVVLFNPPPFISFFTFLLLLL